MTTFFLFPNTADAIRISPTKQTITIDPGKEELVRVTVVNTEESDMVLTPQVDAFSIEKKTGAPVFGAPDVAVDWVRATPPRLLLTPGEQSEFLFIVSAPREVEPGSHGLGFFAATAPGEGQIGIGTRVGSIVYVVVSGEVKEDMTAETFLLSRSVTFTDTVQLSLHLTNRGTVHVVPEGDVIATNMFGAEVVRRPMNPQRGSVLPGGSYEREMVLDRLPWYAFGKVTVESSIRYGNSGKRLATATSFWFFPWEVLAGTGVVITAGLSLAWYRKRKRNVPTV